MSGVTGLAAVAATQNPVSGGRPQIRTGRHLRGGWVGAGGASTFSGSSNSARVMMRQSRRVVVTAQRSDGARPMADAAMLLRGRGAAGAGLTTTTVAGCHPGGYNSASAAGGIHTVRGAVLASGRRRRRPALAAKQHTQVNSTMAEEVSEQEMYAAVEGMNLGKLPFSEPVGQGLWRDMTKRLFPLWVGDFKDGLCSQVFATSLFMFVACLSTAATFGVGTAVLTNGAIGPLEMILSSSVCGVIYALSCGQPVALPAFGGVHLGFTGVLFGLSQVLGVEFFPFYAWVGIWAGFFLLIATLTSVSNLVNYFTRFTDETFSALSACIFMFEACKSLTKGFFVADPDPGYACLTALIGTLTCGLVFALKWVRSSAVGVKAFRERIAEFAPTISIVASTAIASHLCTRLSVGLESLSLPQGLNTTTGRPWLVDLWALEPRFILLATIPALMLASLLFMDQVITTRLVNTRDNNLRKGYGYHLDLAIVAIYCGAASCFGLPWMTAATVPTLNHMQSLSVFDSETGAKLGVKEQRLSGALVHLLMGSTLLTLGPVMELVPKAVFMGLFLFLGMSAAMRNRFLNRAMLLGTDPTLYDSQLTPELREIAPGGRKTSINSYTLIQLACLYCLWSVKSIQMVGIAFPLLVVLLVPMRIIIVSRVKSISTAALSVLDDVADPIAWGKRQYAIETGLLTCAVGRSKAAEPPVAVPSPVPST